MVLLTVSCAFIFQWRNWINPWVLGPLFASALLTLSGTHWSAIPPEIQNLSQMFIGWSLGCKFGPDFFKRAPQFLAVVGVCNALALAMADQLVFGQDKIGLAGDTEVRSAVADIKHTAMHGLLFGQTFAFAVAAGTCAACAGPGSGPRAAPWAGTAPPSSRRSRPTACAGSRCRRPVPCPRRTRPSCVR